VHLHVRRLNELLITLEEIKCLWWFGGLDVLDCGDEVGVGGRRVCGERGEGWVGDLLAGDEGELFQELVGALVRINNEVMDGFSCLEGPAVFQVQGGIHERHRIAANFAGALALGELFRG
jgi:hypothetical protein